MKEYKVYVKVESIVTSSVIAKSLDEANIKLMNREDWGDFKIDKYLKWEIMMDKTEEK